jgi:hypothetical protein
MLEKGILLLATGHGYYGRYAFNLAASIKAVENIPIAVVCDPRGISHISDRQKAKVFDIVIPLPDNIKGGFGAKLHLSELTPFKETIFLDADMLWLTRKTPSMLFEELSGVEFTGITEGYYDVATGDSSKANNKYYFWADPAEIAKVYKVKAPRIYQWRSEFIYFKKTKTVDKVFKKAQEVQGNPKLSNVKQFAGNVPDELGINVATAVYGIEPHLSNWTPAYWHKLNRDIIPSPGELHSNWYLISFGSNYASGTVKKIYDQLTKAAMNKIGMQHIFSLHSKKEFLTERSKM